jgi:hypothetical protein
MRSPAGGWCRWCGPDLSAKQTARWLDQIAALYDDLVACELGDHGRRHQLALDHSAWCHPVEQQRRCALAIVRDVVVRSVPGTP